MTMAKQGTISNKFTNRKGLILWETMILALAVSEIVTSNQITMFKTLTKKESMITALVPLGLKIFTLVRGLRHPY
jgi:hypothetical protein